MQMNHYGRFFVMIALHFIARNEPTSTIRPTARMIMLSFFDLYIDIINGISINTIDAVIEAAI